LVLNLAHAQTRAGQLAPAQATYGRLLTEGPAALSSVARQQLAVLAAQEGQVARALALLRQALLLDPKNSAARYDYEVLSEYLARHPDSPKIPAPPPEPKDNKPEKPPQSSPEKGGAQENQPAEKAGTDRQGQVNDNKPAPAVPTAPPERRPNPTGQSDDQPASPAPSNSPAKGRKPGAGPAQPVASGEAPGNQQGIDRASADPAPATGASPRANRPGAAAALPDDMRLQTQRERLEAMNLSPAQARQLLETLRAQEQQYLQQLTRPSAQKPDPSKPTW
jgi:tetratricopeptide (TPR) repeat protein